MVRPVFLKSARGNRVMRVGSRITKTFVEPHLSLSPPERFANEVKALTFMNETGVPIVVPRLLHADPRSLTLSMSRVDVPPVSLHEIMLSSDKSQNRPLLRSAAQVLNTIHSHGSLTPNRPDSIRYFAHIFMCFRAASPIWRRISLQSRRMYSALEHCLSYVSKLEDTSVIIHGDYWSDNLVIHQGQVVGAIDWEHSHASSKYVDLGKTNILMCMRYQGGAEFWNGYESPVDMHAVAIFTLCESIRYLSMRPLDDFLVQRSRNKEFYTLLRNAVTTSLAELDL